MNSSNKPNVLLIMVDQLRADALGCYGNEFIETVNLDWLASQGSIFTNAYTPVPSCTPARSCLLSGQDPWNTGILGMGAGQGPMGTGFTQTIPGELTKAGYHTQGVGALGFEPPRALNGFHNTILDLADDDDSDYKKWFDANKNGDFGINDHGLDANSWMSRPYHAPEFLHQTNWTVNESINFLKKRDPEKPFFLKTSFYRPHSPYDPPTFFYDLYDKKDLPAPSVGEWAAIHDVPEDAAKPDAWRGKRSLEEARRAKVGYYGSIHHIDHQIGRLLMFMKRNQLFENTLIIFTSDHGDMLGDHNLWRKTYAYEGSTHIPIIVRLPESMQNETVKRKVDNPVLLQDIMPTILQTAGLEIPDTVDGSSMLGLIRDEDTNWRDFVHGEHCTCYSEVQEMQYVTDGKEKYIWFPRTNLEQFFDLEDDPNELHDLSEDPAFGSRVDHWRKRLIGVLASRNAGLTEGDRLISQAGKPPIVSPKYAERMSLK